MKSVITINHKIEVLTEQRGNKKYVFQHAFEAEMPEDYEKGTSKSFTAYEYIKDRPRTNLPENLVHITGSSYGLSLKEPIDHSVETLLNRLRRMNWLELNQAISEWQEPKMEQYVQTFWTPQLVAPSGVRTADVRSFEGYRLVEHICLLGITPVSHNSFGVSCGKYMIIAHER